MKNDGTTYFYTNSWASFCEHGVQPIYSDGRNEYVHCKECDKIWNVETGREVKHCNS